MYDRFEFIRIWPRFSDNQRIKGPFRKWHRGQFKMKARKPVLHSDRFLCISQIDWHSAIYFKHTLAHDGVDTHTHLQFFWCLGHCCYANEPVGVSPRFNWISIILAFKRYFSTHGLCLKEAQFGVCFFWFDDKEIACHIRINDRLSNRVFESTQSLALNHPSRLRFHPAAMAPSAFVSAPFIRTLCDSLSHIARVKYFESTF